MLINNFLNPEDEHINSDTNLAVKKLDEVLYDTIAEHLLSQEKKVR